MSTKLISVAKFTFVFGAILDGLIAVSWFLIAAGMKLPNILCGYIGTGQDYQFAMYIGAMFMACWSALLAWGAVKPIERQGLLLIAAIYLLLSVIIELTFFNNILGGGILIFGVTKRLILTVLFAAVYFYTSKQTRNA